MNNVRDAVVAAARSIVGLTDPDPRLLSLVAPADTPERQAQIAKTSLCMLVTLGIEEAVFEVPPRPPYIEGTAPRLLEARAQGYPWAPGGALRLATLEAPPQLGDSVWYGKGPGGPEHAELVNGVEITEAGIAAECIAGGERDGAHHETVAVVERSWRWNGHQWVDLGTGRPIIAVLDADALAGLYGLRGTI